MQTYTFTTEPPACWEEVCTENNALFGSREWQAMLERSFRCSTIYGWNGVSGLAITVFRIGPFGVGYAGFPTGAVIGPTETRLDYLASLRRAALPRFPVCIRIPVSGFRPPVECELSFQSNPETAITGLKSWDAMSVSKHLRRDIRKAERGGFDVVDVSEPAAGAALYGIYRATVKRHRGARRYNEAYFSALIELGRRRRDLRIMAARHLDRIAGFVVTARHGGTTYYLHGGTDPRYRRNGPSDLLLHRAISAAQRDGSDCFNMMPSPPKQASLIRYKEKWGATTRELRTYTLPLTFQYHAFRVAEYAYRLLR